MPQSPVVSPTPTDVLMEEEEEEEEAKKTEEEKGKEKDTETAEAEGGRKGAEAGGGKVAKQPEGVTMRSRSTTKRRLRYTGAAEAKQPEGVTTRGKNAEPRTRGRGMRRGNGRWWSGRILLWGSTSRSWSPRLGKAGG